MAERHKRARPAPDRSTTLSAGQLSDPGQFAGRRRSVSAPPDAVAVAAPRYVREISPV